MSAGGKERRDGIVRYREAGGVSMKKTTFWEGEKGGGAYLSVSM